MLHNIYSSKIKHTESPDWICVSKQDFDRLNIDVKVKRDKDEEKEQIGSNIHQNDNFRINQEVRTQKPSESLSLQKASSSNCQTSVWERERARERIQTKAQNGLFLYPPPLSHFSTIKKRRKY